MSVASYLSIKGECSQWISGRHRKDHGINIISVDGINFGVQMVNEEQNKDPEVKEVLEVARRKENVGELSQSYHLSKFLPRLKIDDSGLRYIAEVADQNLTRME